jgi:hypothetical protein
MANQPLAVPAGMRRISRRFERWREAHKPRTPFPESLWTSAAEAAREHGVYRTAKVLRLESGKLKRAVEAAASNGRPPVRRGAPLEPGPATFFELPPPQETSCGSAPSECHIELEGPRGKMRLQWKGATAAELAGLIRSLWGAA